MQMDTIGQTRVQCAPVQAALPREATVRSQMLRGGSTWSRGLGRVRHVVRGLARYGRGLVALLVELWRVGGRGDRDGVEGARERAHEVANEAVIV